MRIRPGAMPEDPEGGGRSDPGRDGRPDPWRDPGRHDAAGPDPAEGVRFRASRSRLVFALVGIVAFTALAVPRGDPSRRWPALLIALVLAGYALREVLVPVRLAAGPDGLTVVTGFAGHRRVSWAEVERIRVDTRPRLGLRSQVLEIDLGEALYLFGPGELGVPCADALAAIERVRPAPAR